MRGIWRGMIGFLVLWLAAGVAGAGDEAGAPESAPIAENGPADLARGKHVYETLCWTCHGKYGRGDGPLAGNLAAPPPDLTVAARLETRTDDELVARLRPGGGGKHTPMAVGQSLSEQSLRDAIAHVRTLYVPGGSVSVAAGRDIYNTICWTCHGLEGDGKGPMAERLEGPKPRDFTSPSFVIAGREAEVARVISEGAAKAFHGSEYMLEWGDNLSPQQIADLVAYLRTFQAIRHAAPKKQDAGAGEAARER